ncbi:MAG: dTDP-glucose 4,6-dehydratase [Candidatus Omnitrophica bacterium 4484_213]|nr:MAG: dTDP-glucose 4,6-dehydratase [Candidatus Omnitrophica bacterium 4484_213]
MRILVTGGAGFIGSEFVRQIIPESYKPIVVDKLTYAGDLERLKEVRGKYKFYKADICNKKKIEEIFAREKPQIIVNFAAETHVDRSIINATPFIETNIKGTQVLLDASEKYKIKKFIHISTDETYGEIKKGRFSEDSPLSPNSPYAASKAAADLLIRAYIRTYKFPAMIIRPCNNYGPWQYPEKFIPVVICKALQNKKIPVYAQGLNRREWLYVADCVAAIALILEKGKIGKIYNVGSGVEKRNIDVAKSILKMLGKSENLIQFVKDRPGHDFRYALDSPKIQKLGWKPKVDFYQGLRKTVKWFTSNSLRGFREKRWIIL